MRASATGSVWIDSFGATSRGHRKSFQRQITEKIATTAGAGRHNTGTIAGGPFADVSIGTWREVLTVNLDSVFLLSQRFGVPMIERAENELVRHIRAGLRNGLHPEEITPEEMIRGHHARSP